MRNWSYKLEQYQKLIEQVEYRIPSNRINNVSVIIISWRLHPDTLDNLRRLHEQRDQLDFNVIFVNNGGAYSEFQPLLEYIDTYVVLNENTGAYLARNIGALFSDAPILFFLEDDGIPDKQLLRAHYLVHQKYDVIAVQGVYLFKTENQYNEYQHHYYYGSDFFPKYSELEGNSSYNAEAFFKVGGWDDDINFGGGGVDLSIRLSEVYPQLSKQLYSPICVLLHDYVVDAAHLATKRAKQLNSHTRLMSKHKNWNDYIRSWSDKQIREMALHVNSHWTYENEKDLQSLKASIITRNTPYINQYMESRLFLSELQSGKKQLLNRDSKHRIIIFGAGESGKRMSKWFKNVIDGNLVFADNNADLWGETIDQIKVINPNEITTKDYIYIASMWRQEIGEQLRNWGLKPGEHYCYVI